MYRSQNVLYCLMFLVVLQSQVGCKVYLLVPFCEAFLDNIVCIHIFWHVALIFAIIDSSFQAPLEPADKLTFYCLKYSIF